MSFVNSFITSVYYQRRNQSVELINIVNELFMTQLRECPFLEPCQVVKSSCKLLRGDLFFFIMLIRVLYIVESALATPRIGIIY